MSTITINIPDEQLEKLKKIASGFKVAPEELIRASVEDLLARPEEGFQHALEYILHKNADLYQRLA